MKCPECEGEGTTEHACNECQGTCYLSNCCRDLVDENKCLKCGRFCIKEICDDCCGSGDEICLECGGDGTGQ